MTRRHPAGAGPRAGVARSGHHNATAFVADILIALILVSAPLLGCAESASPAQDLSAINAMVLATGPSSTPAPAPAQTPATAAEPKPSSSSGGYLSLHERVMAERGREGGSREARPPATKTTPCPDAVAGQAATASTNQPETDATQMVQAGAAVVLSDGRTPLAGVWGGTADRLASYLLRASPSAHFTVPVSTLAEYYVHYCEESGLRADVLWAQMILETGYGVYGGDVAPEQNNYAGIGATGGGEPGAWFITAEAGVMAQIAHMVAYVYPTSPVPWANAHTDPRFDCVNPRGVAYVVSDLNGRWAVPGHSYGQSIERIVREINAR